MVQRTSDVMLKIFKKVDRGMDPYKAYVSEGEPTTWANALRQINSHRRANGSQAAPGPTPVKPTEPHR